jgi:hypothetical protein
LHGFVPSLTLFIFQCYLFELSLILQKQLSFNARAPTLSGLCLCSRKPETTKPQELKARHYILCSIPLAQVDQESLQQSNSNNAYDKSDPNQAILFVPIATSNTT